MLRATGHRHAGADAHRARPGRRPRGRPQARRRRLPDQAVRGDRAARPPRGAAAPHAGGATPAAADAGHARYRFGEVLVDVRRAEVRAAARRSSSRPRSSSCCATSSSTAAPRCRATSCCRRCGATRACRRRAPSTCTSPGCGRSSSPIRKLPQHHPDRARARLQVRRLKPPGRPTIAGDAASRVRVLRVEPGRPSVLRRGRPRARRHPRRRRPGGGLRRRQRRPDEDRRRRRAGRRRRGDRRHPRVADGPRARAPGPDRRCTSSTRCTSARR